MPLIPIQIDDSTVAITSVVTGAITLFFCSDMGLKPGVSLVIAAGVGLALYNLGVVPIGLLAAVGYLMFRTIFNKEKNATKTQPRPESKINCPKCGKPISRNSRECEFCHSNNFAIFKGKTNASIPAQRNIAAPPTQVPISQQRSVVDWFSYFTLNEPDEDQLRNMLGSALKAASDIEQARLRVCLSVVNAVVSLSLLDKIQNSEGPALSTLFLEQIRSSLEDGDLSVHTEEYVFEPIESAQLNSNRSNQGNGGRVVPGMNQIRISNLVQGLIQLRRSSILSALEEDYVDASRLFPRTSRLTVEHFFGHESGTLPYGKSLPTMIGAYLAKSVPSAMSELGQMYFGGQTKEIPQDLHQALRWFTSAANLGNADAQFFIGTMYENGEVLPKNSLEAMKCYAQAAAGGNGAAQLILATRVANP